MTKEEIEEGNAIIAVFMGVTTCKRGDELKFEVPFKDQGYICYDVSGLLYNSSWDWLIPACKKFCESTDHRNYGSIEKGEVVSLYRSRIRYFVGRFDIEEAFECLYRGVEYYNKLNHENKRI